MPESLTCTNLRHCSTFAPKVQELKIGMKKEFECKTEANRSCRESRNETIDHRSVMAGTESPVGQLCISH